MQMPVAYIGNCFGLCNIPIYYKCLLNFVGNEKMVRDDSLFMFRDLCSKVYPHKFSINNPLKFSKKNVMNKAMHSYVFDENYA